MAKYCGMIGYAVSSESETQPGVWINTIIERKAYGDLVRISRKSQTTENVNDDISIDNELSIVAEPFALSHLQFIKYITMYGSKWKVTSVRIEHPRLILSVGGIYNE